MNGNATALDAAVQLMRAGIVDPSQVGNAATVIFARCFPDEFDAMNPHLADQRRAVSAYASR